MHKIFACIVTYNPDIKVLEKNVNSFISDVDDIVIIDNNSSNFDILRKIFTSDKISFIRNSENIGIAAALNQGLDLAVEKKSEFLLTMDQDSFFDDKGLWKLKNKLNELDKKVAIVGPSMRDINSDFTEYLDKEVNIVNTIITSGALCRTNVLKEVGGWNEKLFIDAVDFDICYKLKLQNFLVIKINNIFLNHNLGDSVKKKFIINFLITNHSPLRIYYQFRNTVYLQKTYYKYFFKDVFQMFFSNGKKLLGILLFEQNKTKKLKYSILGFWDGINNNYGKKVFNEKK